LIPVVVTSTELEARLEPLYRYLRIAPGQLQALTGIRERRWWEPGYPLSHGAIVAARKTLSATGISPDEIGALIKSEGATFALASCTLALGSHAPGGLGVLEFSFLKAMPDAPPASVLAALLVFRLLYLILPLLFALFVVVAFERERIGELVRTRLRGRNDG